MTNQMLPNTVQVQIEEKTQRLRTGDLGIPLNPEERFANGFSCPLSCVDQQIIASIMNTELRTHTAVVGYSFDQFSSRCRFDNHVSDHILSVLLAYCAGHFPDNQSIFLHL